jgi:putative phosphoesterase
MYIGLISDTHGTFADDVKEFLAPVDVIWHAGDFGGGIRFARKIAEYKPLLGVHGNVDGMDIRSIYPRFQQFECEGLRVLMTHIGLMKGAYWGFTPRQFPYDTVAKALIDTYHPDLFIYGHTHIPQVVRDPSYGMLLMNPGACGFEGPREVPRMALRFHIVNGKIDGLEKCEWHR